MTPDETRPAGDVIANMTGVDRLDTQEERDRFFGLLTNMCAWESAEPKSSRLLRHCPRCGVQHENFITIKLTNANPYAARYSHWGLCPTTGEPVLMGVPISPEIDQLCVQQESEFATAMAIKLRRGEPLKSQFKDEPTDDPKPEV